MSAMLTMHDVDARARAELGRGEVMVVKSLALGDKGVRSPEEVHEAGLWRAEGLRICGWTQTPGVSAGQSPRYLAVRLLGHVTVVEETEAYEIRRRNVADVIYRDDVQVATLHHFTTDVVSKPGHDVCVWCKYDNSIKNDRDGWNCGYCGGN